MAERGNSIAVWSQNLKATVMSCLHIPQKPPTMKNRIACFVFGIAVACAFASCATYSKVSEKRPRYNPAAGRSGAMATAEAKIIKALQVDRRDPLVALGEYMTAAEIASGQPERHPDTADATHDYTLSLPPTLPTTPHANR